MSELRYDIIVIGGGIVGPAATYVAAGWARHSGSPATIALLEKESGLATVASGHEKNSQTLHFGDIETNMSLAQARRVQAAAEYVAAYIEANPDRMISVKRHKMCIAVGTAEIARLRERVAMLQPYYPKIRLIDRDEIAALEPNVVAGRDPDEPIAALLSPDGFIVNYGRLAESFARDATAGNPYVETFYRTSVDRIVRTVDGYDVYTNRGTFYARGIIVAAGGYSLVLAKQLGLGGDWELIPVAGSFYRTTIRDCVRGKVYTEQNPEIPFAAPHADPEVMNPNETRFGPTAKLVPLLERHRWGTFSGFLKTIIWNPRGLWAYLAVLLSSKVLLRFVLRNLFLDLPILGKWMYLRDIRKIIPSMRSADIELARGVGGIRPQIVDVRERVLRHGEGKIRGDRAVFLITPSPGASVCLQAAEEAVADLLEMLGPEYAFDRERFRHHHTRTARASAA
ncbi:MAG: FAD-dependent oxidoreductase [bacterium]|nr:FAD-dependent oxidoreductase [bacterium]